MQVPATAVWEPPWGATSTRNNKVEEPWWKDKAKWKAHCEAVRKSLEDFINDVLDRFSGMVRGGDHFVFDEARAKVVKCEPISDEVFAEVRRRWDAQFPK